jgi:oleandomycin transport system permease protein
MPGWLRAFAKVNPVTHVIDATRGLMLGGPVAEPVFKSVIWLAVISAAFAPLAIARYRRRISKRSVEAALPTIPPRRLATYWQPPE